jgi:hypothetical protein
MSGKDDNSARKEATRKARQARLAAQLKANLRRRKAQARAREEKPSGAESKG